MRVEVARKRFRRAFGGRLDVNQFVFPRHPERKRRADLDLRMRMKAGRVRERGLRAAQQALPRAEQIEVAGETHRLGFGKEDSIPVHRGLSVGQKRASSGSASRNSR